MAAGGSISRGFHLTPLMAPRLTERTIYLSYANYAVYFRVRQCTDAVSSMESGRNLLYRMDLKIPERNHPEHRPKRVKRRLDPRLLAHLHHGTRDLAPKNRKGSPKRCLPVRFPPNFGG